MDVVKRRQQVLKYYRYCLRKARELMRSELRKWTYWQEEQNEEKLRITHPNKGC